MKKLLYIKDSEQFWRVFGEEREKVREKLRQLPFAEKIEIMARMRKLFPRPIARGSEPDHHQAATGSDTECKKRS